MRRAVKGERRDLFIGVTSFNSEFFVGACIESMMRTTQGLDREVVVLDNVSRDRTAAVARERGARIVVRACSQGDALSALLRMSTARFTLLVHADVVMLSPRWFELCTSQMDDGVALVSPEDIGCGPYTRPFGKDKPESSFLFCDTVRIWRTHVWRWRRWRGIVCPERVVDFYGPHVTHRLPDRLGRRGLSWRRMDVYASPKSDAPIYTPDFRPEVWVDELRYLRYGLGNFYGLDATITHYHNWYDRVPKAVAPDSRSGTERAGGGFPAAYIAAYSAAFLKDYREGRLWLPCAGGDPRIPRAL